MRLFFIASAVSLVTGCRPAEPDPRTYLGCYAADGWHAEIGQRYLKLNNPPVTLPARLGRDKLGDFVLVERPVWYVRQENGGLRLVTYRGIGTYFPLNAGQRPSLELPVVDEDGIVLSKIKC